MKVAYTFQTQEERDENVYELKPACFGQFDPRDPASFVVGYLARHAGLTSIALPPQWMWHRVNVLDVANKSITLYVTTQTPPPSWFEHTIRLSFETEEELLDVSRILEDSFAEALYPTG